MVQVVEDLVHRVNPVGGEEIRAGKCARRYTADLLKQGLRLLQPVRIVVKGPLVQLVTNIPTVVVQVGADEFTGDVRRVGVGPMAEFPGVVD